jgi:peptidoglycan glycosyltransferase
MEIRGFQRKPRQPKPQKPNQTKPRRPQSERERRLRHRALPLAAIALAAFIWGALSGAGSAQEDAAQRFVDAWTKQDFAAMHKELTSDAQKKYPVADLQAAYLEAQTAATATAIDPGDISQHGNEVDVDVGVRTRIFGKVDGTLKLPFEDDKIAWAPHLTFPGLHENERVGRRLKLGNRASILTKDGTLLAEGQGDSRRSAIGSAGVDITGEVGDPDPELKAKVQASGYPGDQPTGVSGLELAFNSVLAGTPGGDLLAVPEDTPLPDVPQSVQGRTLASADGAPGRNVRTTIDPDLQQVAVSALGGRAGGVAVLDARDGSVKALAGQAYSSLQPPGSTFKVITTTAGLEENKVKLDEQFPVVSSINPSPQTGARVINNAHNETCGGDFTTAFAKSCNTVFAPLGVQVGESKLIDTAEKYGFNQEPTLYNAEATAAAEPGKMAIPTSFDDPTNTELSASAIGQGEVLATTLGMASVAQTVANGGVRSPTPIAVDPELQSDAKPVQVTSKENARVLTSLMKAVVTEGTATSAALPNVQVAGKTGTAELGPDPNAPPPKNPGDEPEQIVDAWFIAFAPADNPKLAVAAMLVDAPGDGGEVAAPIVRQILDTAF